MVTAPEQQTNLWTAAGDGNLDRVKHLLENEGLSANDQDANGYTAVHAAVSWAHPTLLRYLLSKGGDINVIDNDGDTPLFTVESLDICKLVLELGGDPHLCNKAGQTAAQSLQEEHPEISEFLCTLTGESLGESAPVSASQAPSLSLPSSTAQEQAEAAAIAFENAQPPEEVLELDPMSRAAAIETNHQAGALLARVQAILEETDRTGEDPEPRIREIVNEAVQNTMNAGRQLGESRDTTEFQQGAIAATELDETTEKRQRRDEEPER